ncbi:MULTISPECIES: glycosyltransferase family 4 protein [Olivibacter]|jgi:hypothetical protein|uniref:Glycosyltransferase family 4 protein n=1 Tax=Olivibacter oleidegradans TaxID=760123 RepID=A0ABV6HRS1_9SPHI|nr:MULTISPECIES: glycosyltransferase family 4 protein [Olivibacter]MDM8176220.1 glycosyltransferase family 4 protein [Olivibacter sp. 47]
MGKEVKKVLVATNHLEGVGGSELYTYDLIKALSELLGIEVEYFTFDKGLISDKIEGELKVPFMSKKKYDLIFANHNTTVRELFSRAPIIQICHGVLPELEQPSPLADFHVAISEEVSLHLNELGYQNEVILNGIDIQTKKPTSSPNQKLKRVLSLCQSEKANIALKEICASKGLDFSSYNKHKNPIIEVEKVINRFDLVVGIGRSIYDAMACGRPCLIYDNRGYNGNRADGYLRPEKFWKYITKNCSGRYLNRQYKETELIREMEKYDPKDGERLREIALSTLNAHDMARNLLLMTDYLTWQNRLNKWKRFTSNTKLVKRAFFYKRIYNATKWTYFNKTY